MTMKAGKKVAAKKPRKKKVIYQFETMMTYDPPSFSPEIRHAVDAISNSKIGRPVRNEDNAQNIGDAIWKELQEAHHNVHRSYRFPVIVQVLENGELIILTKK